LSSAILYLAIVAIWAVVLVPRWLRPRPAPPQPVPVPAEDAGAGRRDPADPGQDAGPAWTASARGPDTEGEQAPGADAAAGAAENESQEPAAALSPVARRPEVVKARRRLLTTLTGLTVIAMALAVTGIDAYWIIVPPAALLSGYLLLLRQFAHFDAERSRRAARSRHAGQVRAAQEPGNSQEPVPAAAGPGAESVPGAPTAPADAEIIDISGRIVDQVYDQYTDAANRAVGD
jgi:hypothetical protein